MADFPAVFKGFVRDFLGEEWSQSCGVEESIIDAAAARIGVPIPAVLRAFYLTVGQMDGLCEVHNRILSPAELYVDGDYLMFMDENQSVVSWGIPTTELELPDPVAWQRQNTTPAQWYSEEKTVSALFADMFSWYTEIGVWGPAQAAPAADGASRRS